MNIDDVIPPSGTAYNIQFQVENVKTFPINSLKFHKDISRPINGGEATTPLDMDLYNQLRVNQAFKLYFRWEREDTPKLLMSGYLSYITLTKDNIEIEFTDNGSKLTKTGKLRYSQRPRLRIIDDVLDRSGLKRNIDWSKGEGDIIDFNGGSEDINGKPYGDMLQELVEGSMQDLVTVIEYDTCKIVNTANIQSIEVIPIFEGVNIVKDSVSISEMSSDLNNHITLYYKDDTHQNYVIRMVKGSVNRFGERRGFVEKNEIQNPDHARDYADKLLKKNNRENGFQLNLTVIASTYYNLLTSCHVQLPKYGIDRMLRVSCLNFEASANKTPVMDLTLNDYSQLVIS